MTRRPAFLPTQGFGFMVFENWSNFFRAAFSISLVVATASIARSTLAQSISATGPADDPTRQTEKDWVDERWSKTEIGHFLRTTVETPRKATARGIAIKVGTNDDATVCFDTDLLRYSAGWTGGFIRISGQRYGLMGAVSPAGEIQFSTDSEPGWARDSSFKDPRESSVGALPRDWAKYKGLYVSGNRVVLSYSVGQMAVLDSPWFERSGELRVFSRSLELGPSDSAQALRLINFPNSAVSLSARDGLTLGTIRNGDQVMAIAILGDHTELFVEGESINLRVLPHKEQLRAKVLICNTAAPALKDFAAFARSAVSESLAVLTRGGAPRWGNPLVTRGHVDRTGSAFAIDTITMPYENPWDALFFTSGHDFFNNGDAAVAAIHGDVWRVSGLDENLEKISWKRFATGLYQPLGLKIINDKVHVLERDQITILHDLNNDGEADFYENFNNDCIGAGGGHSYTTSLETDSEGSFWFAKCAENTPHGGTVLKVPKDGSGIEVIATGFRNPNGLGIGPDDIVTVADQQGDWVPETRLDVIRRVGFYGFTPMHKRAVAPTTFDPPLAWIPRAIDNSAGGQVWVPKGTWGPLGGEMLHLSYGRCTMMLVLREGSANPPIQGAVVPLPGRFASGVCRGRFNSRDGHLYVTGLRGWQTAAVRDGCFQRVRYQKTLTLPSAYGVKSDEIRITFSETLDRELAEDVESYSAEAWNYRWSANYGSPDFSVENPEKQGRDKLQIEAARLEADGNTVVLKVRNLKAAHQLAVTYNLETKDGEAVQSAIYATLNSVTSEN